MLIVYRRYLGFKTLTNYFVYNIAVADLCMSFNMLVQMFFFIWPQLSTSEHLCLFRMELMTFFTTVSMMSGVFATVDRFMIIVVNRSAVVILSLYTLLVSGVRGRRWTFGVMCCQSTLLFAHSYSQSTCIFVEILSRNGEGLVIFFYSFSCFCRVLK